MKASCAFGKDWHIQEEVSSYFCIASAAGCGSLNDIQGCYPLCIGIINSDFLLSEWDILCMVVLETPYSAARPE